MGGWLVFSLRLHAPIHQQLVPQPHPLSLAIQNLDTTPDREIRGLDRPSPSIVNQCLVALNRPSVGGMPRGETSTYLRLHPWRHVDDHRAPPF